MGSLSELGRRLGRRLITTCGGDVEVGREGQLQRKETKTDSMYGLLMLNAIATQRN